jgi:hypothetical protein
MAKIEDIKAELTTLGVPFSEDAKAKDLEKLLKDTKAEAKKNADANKSDDEDNEDADEVSTKFVVWLKSKAYVNDTQRVDAGLYIVDVVPPRLSKLGADACEVFENEVPSKKLAKIARWAGINPDGVEDEEILEKVLKSEFKPY